MVSSTCSHLAELNKLFTEGHLTADECFEDARRWRKEWEKYHAQQTYWGLQEHGRRGKKQGVLQVLHLFTVYTKYYNYMLRSHQSPFTIHLWVHYITCVMTTIHTCTLSSYTVLSEGLAHLVCQFAFDKYPCLHFFFLCTFSRDQ